MKKLLFLFVLVLALSSCSNDDDDEQGLIYQYWGVVSEVQGEDYDYKVVLDIDVVLIPVSCEVPYSGKENDKVYVYFELEPGFVAGSDSVHVNILNIFSYDIKDAVSVSGNIPDSLGTDPLAIYANNVWQSNDLLNLISYYVGDESDVDHIVNLVYFPDSVATDSMGVYLEMRHEAGNAEASDNIVKHYDFFDLTSIAPFANAVDSVAYTLVVNSGDFDGAIEKFEGYYYKSGLR